jgi:hypothetical protein
MGAATSAMLVRDDLLTTHQIAPDQPTFSSR